MSSFIESLTSGAKDPLEHHKKLRPLELLKNLCPEMEAPLSLIDTLLLPEQTRVMSVLDVSHFENIQSLADEINVLYQQGVCAIFLQGLDQQLLSNTHSYGTEIKMSLGGDLPLVLLSERIFDEYQIWQARSWGFDSICFGRVDQDLAELQYFLEICREAGFEAALIAAGSEHLQKVVLQTDAKIIVSAFAMAANQQATVEDIPLANPGSASLRGKILIHYGRLQDPAQWQQLIAQGYQSFLLKDEWLGSSIVWEEWIQLMSQTKVHKRPLT